MILPAAYRLTRGELWPGRLKPTMRQTRTNEPQPGARPDLRPRPGRSTGQSAPVASTWIARKTEPSGAGTRGCAAAGTERHRTGRSARGLPGYRRNYRQRGIGREDVGSASGPASRVVSRLGRSVGGLGRGLTESADAALGLSLETICRPGPRLWHPPALPV